MRISDVQTRQNRLYNHATRMARHVRNNKTLTGARQDEAGCCGSTTEAWILNWRAGLRLIGWSWSLWNPRRWPPHLKVHTGKLLLGQQRLSGVRCGSWRKHGRGAALTWAGVKEMHVQIETRTDQCSDDSISVRWVNVCVE